MRRFARALAVVAVLTLPVFGRGQDRPALRDALALQEVVQQVIDKAEPSIACILVSREDKPVDLARPEHVPEAFGSGVVLDAAGLVLTSAHVVRRATQIYVRLPGEGRGSYAEVYAADPRSDLAVLQLLKPPAGLKAVKFGDGGKVRKGQLVVAPGQPLRRRLPRWQPQRLASASSATCAGAAAR